MQTVTAAQLATQLNVTRARVSQWVSEGKLEGCYSGTGRQRRFDLHKAAKMLDRTLDAGQALGNGAESAQARRQAVQGFPSFRPAAELDDAEDQARYQKARADQAEVRALKERLALAQEEGRYVLSSEVELQVRRAIAAEVAEFESVLRTAASQIAAEHGIEPKAVKGALMQRWREHRARRAEQAEEAAGAAEPTATEAAEPDMT